MPRGASKSAEEKVVTKTPRKRAAPKKTAAEKKPARKTTPRKAVTKKTTAPRKAPTRKTTQKKVGEVEPVATFDKEMTATRRKAPTSFSALSNDKRKQRNQIIIVVSILVIGISASAVLGFTDTTAGQIDVAQTIRERNERMANMVDVDGPVIVAPTPSTLPDGGLRGVQPAAPSQRPVTSPTATSTASSSIQSTASSSATSTDVTAPPGVAESADLERYATDTATTTVEANDPTLTTLAGQ